MRTITYIVHVYNIYLLSVVAFLYIHSFLNFSGVQLQEKRS